MMSNLSYHLNLPSYFLHDDSISDDLEKMKLDAYISSGDYFTLLATKLDEISELLEACEGNISKQLSDLSAELLHLQKNYKIVKS